MPNASIDAANIRDRFNFEWTMNPDNGAEADTFWWYAISIRVDPNEIIADDGEGHLWSVPFTTDGADTITFADPVRVRETFVPVSAGEGAAATAVVSRRRQTTLAAALERPVKNDPGDRPVPSQYTPAASERHDHEEIQVPDIDLAALRNRLGLDEDATEEQINTALATEPEPTIPQAQHEAELETAVAAAREEARAAAQASASDDTVRFDRATAEQLQADARAGREAREQQINAQRDQLVNAAVEDGRIPPARRDHWRQALNADPEGAAQTLASLDKGLIPVEQRGVSKTGDDPSAAAEGTGLFSFPDQKKEA